MLSLSEFVRKNHKTHLIFDFDATLVLIHLPWSEWGEAIREELLSLDSKLFYDWGEGPRVSAMRNAYVRVHGDKAHALFHRYNTQFEHGYTGATPNHELIAEVAELRKEYKLYVWSSNVRSVLDELLGQVGLAGWFDKIISGDDVRLFKPDPEGFELLKEPGVSKKAYLMIGDSTNDRHAAEAAGIDFYHTDFFNQGI